MARRTIDAVEATLGAALALGAALVGLVTGLVLRRPGDERRSRSATAVDPPPAYPLDSLVALVAGPVLVVDAADALVAANAAGLSLGVVRDGKLRNPALLSLVHAARADRRLHETVLEVPVRTGRTHQLRTLEARAGLVEPHELVAVFIEDRTEARRVDDVRRDFVANVSHELKTPVGGLALLAEAVADAADDPIAVRRFAERMQQEAARLSAMVHDLLALSRLQADGGAQPATPVALDRVVTEAVDRCRTAASSRAITLDVRAERGLTVLGDEEQLVTAVRNLVDNAIAYSPPRTRVSVGLRQQAGTVEISVSDQGIGIPASDLERIFERFYRVDPARSRETGGTGLGLSIVKHTVANHGGEVTVWSREGIGSTFTVHLPLLETAPSPAHPTVDPARAANPAKDALSNALSAAAPTVVPTPRPNRAVVGPRRVGPPPALGWTVEETRP